MSVRYEFQHDNPSLSPSVYDVSSLGYDPVWYHQFMLPSLGPLIPPDCVDALGLEVGDEFTVIRELTGGSCQPQFYDRFPTLDIESCRSMCN